MDDRTRQRYQSCLTTPPLWLGTGVSPYPQINLSPVPAPLGSNDSFRQRRLGKLVEEFVFHQLKAHPDVRWITDNLQIQQEKLTVGEIDALYYQGTLPVHLEVAYKFYLYDTLEEDSAPLGRWIGPNRKDRLSYKLEKFHRKQFPLLHGADAARYLTDLGLLPHQINQALCFKAQLFLPLRQTVDVAPLNPDCVAGYYLSLKEFSLLRGAVFHIPAKLDWLIAPHPAVNWLPLRAAVQAITPQIKEDRSPMVWVKRPDDSLEKCFVTFW